MSTQSSTAVLEVPRASSSASSFSISIGSSDFEALLHQKRRRAVRSQKSITAAILEACRTPTVQHWIMVKARLGYDTFWKHMNNLVSLGLMNAVNDGHKTLYSINEKGISLLKQIESSEQY